MALSNKDRKFIEDLYSEYGDVLKSILYKMTKEEQMVEDILHTTFENLIKNIGTVKKVKSNKIKSYLIKAVINSSYTALNEKKKNDNNIIPYDEVTGKIPVYEEAKFNHDDEILNKNISEALDYMSQKYRDIIQYSYMEALGSKDVANLMNITEKSVYVYRKRAIEMLERKVGEFKGNEQA